MELNSARLSVKLAEESEVSGQNRFDRSLWIKQIVLDGQYPFCIQEPEGPDGNPGTGSGLCFEFLTDEKKNGQKYGIGMLQEGQVIHNADHKQTICENCLESVLETLPYEGSAEIRRKLYLEDNCLSIENSFHNKSHSLIHFREYCHNFLALDYTSAQNGNIPTDACLLLPEARGLAEAVQNGNHSKDIFKVFGKNLQITETAYRPASFVLDESSYLRNGLAWRYSLPGKNLSVEESIDFVCAGRKIWMKGGALCPEVFFEESLSPGKKCQWKRKWIFKGPRDV